MEDESKYRLFLNNILNCPQQRTSESTHLEDKLQIYHAKKGRKPIEEIFPNLIEEIERILLLNGYAAHKRRHSDNSEYWGITMPLLRDHLLETIVGLKEKYPKLSPKTILHIFIPPDLGNHSR